MPNVHVLLRKDLKARLEDYSAEIVKCGGAMTITAAVNKAVENYLETTAVALLSAYRKSAGIHKSGTSRERRKSVV